MYKSNIVAIALFGCAFALASIQAEHLADREGHLFEMRPRLGHFKEDPFIDLYKTYASSFVYPSYNGNRAREDYRNYLPSGAECMDFLARFQIDAYELRDTEEVVLLDGCLGYLFESTFHEVDSEQDSIVRDNLPKFIADEKLKALYEGTQINSLPENSQDCIADMLLDSILAKKQYSDVVCNKHWLELFNKFAACQAGMYEKKDSDSYLTVIYNLVQKRGHECFENEINTLNSALRQEYVHGPGQRVGNKINIFSKLSRQAGERYWVKDVKNLLSIVQNTDKEVNMRQVSNIVRGVSIGDQRWMNTLANNMAAQATSLIRPKRDNSDTRADPSGSKRYTALVDKLCKFFRASDSERQADFATPFRHMVKMLSYPEIFAISREEFITKVLNHSYETAPLYLAVSSCNILTFTNGYFERRPQNSKLSYKVGFASDLSEMVRWPDAGFA